MSNEIKLTKAQAEILLHRLTAIDAVWECVVESDLECSHDFYDRGLELEKMVESRRINPSDLSELDVEMLINCIEYSVLMDLNHSLHYGFRSYYLRKAQLARSFDMLIEKFQPLTKEEIRHPATWLIE
tara:strand:+ start:463 stop:846 length:384 start_codon:yes stop_codon:yes gene_type:complete